MAEKIISPGVFTRENDLSFVQTGVAAIGAAIVGPTVKGPNLIPTLVYSYSEYQALYGDAFKSGSNYYQYLTSITAKEYLKHGGPATIVRIMPTDAGNANSYTHLYPSGSLVSTPDALLLSITANPSDCADITHTGVPLASAGGGVGAIATITCSGTGQLLTGANAIFDAISTHTFTATPDNYTPTFTTNGAGLGGAINVTVTSTGVLNHNNNLYSAIQTNTTDATIGVYNNVPLGGGTGATATVTVTSTGVLNPNSAAAIQTNPIDATPGVYNNVTLGGGTGTPATANVTVTSTGVLNLNNNLFGAIQTNTTNAADAIYTGIALTGGPGNGAEATVEVVTGAITSVIITNGGTGYAVADVLTIAAGALGTGQLITADDILAETAATSIGNVTGPFTVAQSSTSGTGAGATLTVTGDGAGALSAVAVSSIGTGYVALDTITITSADLITAGFTGASTDLVVTVSAGMLQDSTAATFTLADANLFGTIGTVTIVTGGTDYVVGDVLTIPAVALGSAADATFDPLTDANLYGTIALSGVTITNGGSGGYNTTPLAVTIAAGALGTNTTPVTFTLANANLFGTISGVTVTTPGSGYEEFNTLTIAAGDLGADSTDVTFTLSGIGDMVGEIIGITITGVGQGYEVGDVLTIAANALGAGSTPGEITLLADDIFNGLSARSGVLTSGSTYAFPTTSFQMFTHTDGELMNSLPGSSLTSLAVASNDVFVSSSVAGVGTKFGTKNNIRWEVSNVNQKKGTFTLAIRRGDDSKKRKVILETWNNCSLDPNENNYIGAVIGTQRPTVGDSTTASPYIQPSGNYKNRSQFVYIDENTILNTIDYLDENGNIRDITATGSLPINGCSGSFFGGAEGTGWAGSANYYEASTAGNFQGLNISNVTSTGYIAYECAFNLLSNQDEYDINLLIAPGITYQMSSALTNKMVTVCEERGDVMTIIDPVDYQTTNIASVVQQAENFDSSYAAMYWPWVQIADPATGKYIWVPQSVIMPSIYAFNDKVSAEWFAPAGLNRGGQETVVQAARKLTHANRDILYEGSVNPVATFPGEGVVVWGQKTLQKKSSALDRVNVRRLLINLKKFIASVSKYLLFENNTTSTRNRFLSQVNPYMESVQQRQGLYAFKVIMDETNNTPDIIDRNIMKGDIFIQPAKAAEFIVIDFNIMPTGATFND